MPVLPRATFFFQEGNYGWTETYHSLKPDLQTTMDAAIALLPFRVPLLAPAAHLRFIRVSDDLIKRDSMIYPVPPGDQYNTSWSDRSGSTPNVCLNVRLEATSIIRRNLSMRGIPGQIVGFAGALEMTAQFISVFTRWGLQLKADQWAVRGTDRLIVKVDIALITQDNATGDVTITTTLPHGLGQNDAVTIRNVTGCKFLNGNWAIFQKVSDTVVKIKMNRILPTWTGGGTISKAGYVLSAITKITEREISHRNAGRPFDSPRGRR